MAERWSDDPVTAQQGQPLLGRLPVEPAQEASMMRSTLIKRKSLPSSTTGDYRPTVNRLPNEAGDGDTPTHDYTKLDNAQALSPEEAAYAIDSREHSNKPDSDTNEGEEVLGSPSGQSRLSCTYRDRKLTKVANSEKVDPIEETRSHQGKAWLPYGLRTWFLIPMMTVAIAFAAICISLMVYSRSHYGLGTDNGQDSVLFGWRFTPTLVAVLYVLGTAIVLKDVQRTGVYARLSSPVWSEAKNTLSRKPGPWW